MAAESVWQDTMAIKNSEPWGKGRITIWTPALPLWAQNAMDKWLKLSVPVLGSL